MVMEEFELQAGNNEMSVISYLLYALPGERWRISAIKVALTAQRDNFHSPDEGIDRIIGILLGYPKESIDSYVCDGISAGTYNKLTRAK